MIGRCPECVPCPHCGRVAYCLSYQPDPPCPHGDGTCGDCWPGTCTDCAEDAERFAEEDD